MLHFNKWRFHISMTDEGEDGKVQLILHRFFIKQKEYISSNNNGEHSINKIQATVGRLHEDIDFLILKHLFNSDI